jgi:hypothetical protein
MPDVDYIDSLRQFRRKRPLRLGDQSRARVCAGVRVISYEKQAEIYF